MKPAMVAALLVLSAATACALGLIEGGAVEEQFAFDRISTLTIDAVFFSVDVVGVRTQDVRGKMVFSEKLRNRNAIRLASSRDGSDLKLSIGHNELLIGRSSISWGPRFALVAPDDVTITIQTNSGSVRVQDLNGATVRIKTVSGDVTILDVKAHLDITAGSGYVYIENATGEKRITSGSGAVTITHSTGMMRIDAESAMKEFRNVTGDITVTTTEQLTITGHRGELYVKADG